MVIRAFITHKQAESFADCQDRFGVNPDTKSIAVSDGMGSTWQQKIWAELLVDTFTKRKDWNPTKESIKPLCQEWRNRVADFIQNLKDKGAPENRIYRNERNLADGRSAGATFVGIRFNGNDWNGSVLGDSCLIEWDGNEVKFNTSQASQTFDSYPDYFDSDASKEGKGEPKNIGGTLTEGKYLLLVSDPFSEFLSEHNKQGNIAKHVQRLLSLSSHDDFETLVCEWRNNGMHNDDTTLVIVENDKSENLTIEYADKIEEMESSQISANHAIENAKTPQENPSQEKDEAVKNFDVVQNNMEDIKKEFLTEFQQFLPKRFPKQKVKLKYKWTQKVVEEVLNFLSERYYVTKK